MQGNRLLLVSGFSLALTASITLGCSSSDPGSDGTAGGSSAANTGGTTNVVPTGGSTNTAGTAPVTGTGGSVTGSGGSAPSSGGIGGVPSTGGQTMTSGGAAGTGAGGMSGAGPVGLNTRMGKSAGCGKDPPAMDSSNNFIKHEVHITGLDPSYLTGGMWADSSGGYDFSFRPYAVRLPANYDSSKPYAVTFGGGGCGGSAQNFAGNPGGGLQIAPNGQTIQVGLSYLNTCFKDGGPSIGNRPDSPEEPYFRTIMAELEQNYCIDLSKVFVAGYSSGGWEAFTLGCAASDIVRGIGTDEGGLRTMHPSCKAPIAAVMVAGLSDTENPIGPLDPVKDKGTVDRLGSLGSAPGRDEILMRNGCTGSASTMYTDAKYGQCVKYTTCPPAYPVVWCALPGVGHNNSSYNGTNYSPGPMWDILSNLPNP